LKTPDIQDFLKKIAGCRILVIGDVMVDTYLWGQVSRISPEAPVPVVMHRRSENRMGGAANVALNIRSLGAEPLMCAVIGSDENGRVFRKMTEGLGMTVRGLVESNLRTTTCKTRIFAGHQQLLRLDMEDDQYVDAGMEEDLWKRILTFAGEGTPGAIVFQDYDKGVITPQLIERTIQLANEKGIPTLIDPKRRNFNYYRNATLFKPNFKEMTEGLNLHLQKENTDELLQAARQLQLDAQFKMVMITLSEKGMLICTKDEVHLVPTRARDVADVSGAGDTVIAMASLCLAAGLSARETAELSNLAAGLVCEKAGVVPVERDWLLGYNR